MIDNADVFLHGSLFNLGNTAYLYLVTNYMGGVML